MSAPTPTNKGSFDLDYRPHSESLGTVYQEALRELRNPYPSAKLPDWRKFNQITGGFRTREFTILCGATGVGKTTFLANLSAQFLKGGIKHFIASVETGHTDFVKRAVSVMAGEDLNTGDAVAPDKLRWVDERVGDLFSTDTAYLSLYDNRIPIETLLKDLRYHAEVRRCKVAMIDNLNFFMEVTKAADTLVEMDKVIHELIIFCKQVDLHIIMVMHPKKTEGGRVVSEFDIKGSSTAVQEAHNVFLFNRMDPKDLHSGHPDDRELTFQKMRRRGKFTGAKLIFNNVNSQYTEGDLR